MIQWLSNLGIIILAQKDYPHNLILYDYRDGNEILQLSISQYFSSLPPYFISDLIEEDQFVIVGATEVCLVEIKKSSRTQVSLTFITCIQNQPEMVFDTVLTKLEFYQLGFMVLSYYNVYDLNIIYTLIVEPKLNELKIVANYTDILDVQFCSLGCGMSNKHNVMITSNMFKQVLAKSKVNSIILATWSNTDPGIFVGQIDQDYFYFTTIYHSIQYYSFQTLNMIREIQYHNSNPQKLFYYPFTKDIYIFSEKQLYVGNLDFGSVNQVMKFLILDSFTSYMRIMLVEQLDILVVINNYAEDLGYFYQQDINSNQSYLTIYSNSNGKLLKEIKNIAQVYPLNGLNMLVVLKYDENTYQLNYFLYDLTSVLSESLAIMDRNQSILPLLTIKEQGLIYTTTIESHLFAIETLSQSMQFIMKRGSQINTMRWVSSEILLIQSLDEIIFLDGKLQKIKSTIPLQNLHIDVINVNIENDGYFIDLLYAKDSFTVCKIRFKDFNKYGEQACLRIELKVLKINCLDQNTCAITHSNGKLTVLNVKGTILTVFNNQSLDLHKKKYEIISLSSYKSGSIVYIFTFSLDMSVTVQKIEYDSSQNTIIVEQQLLIQYKTKISQVFINSSQKYSVISLLYNRSIDKISLDSLINEKKQSKTNYFLPFTGYFYQIKMYENLNYLIAFTQHLYAIFDLVLTEIKFVSRQSYIGNYIYDVEMIDKDHIAISTQTNFSLQQLDFYSFRITHLGESLNLFTSQQKFIKIFDVQLSKEILLVNNVQQEQIKFSSIGYSQMLNQLIFNIIPIFSSSISNTCNLEFNDPTYQDLKKIIVNLQSLSSQMTNKANTFSLKLVLNKRLINDNNQYISNKNVLIIPPNLSYLSIQLVLTGQEIYLDNINLDQVKTYSKIVFESATLNILSSVNIENVNEVKISACNILPLSKSNNNQNIQIALNQITQLTLEDIKIMNSLGNKIFPSVNFQINGITENVLISNWHIEGIELNQTRELIEINSSKIVQITKFNILKNNFNCNYNQILKMRDIDQVDFSNSKVVSNKLVNLEINDNESKYLFVTKSVRQTTLNSVQFKGNTNCLLYLFQNSDETIINGKKDIYSYIDSSITINDLTCQSNQLLISLTNTPSLFNITEVNNVQIINSKFYFNNIKYSYLFSLVRVTNSDLTEAKFDNNQSLSCVIAQSGFQIRVKDSQFSNNNSLDSGSALFLKGFINNIQSSNIIINSKFLNNKSTYFGGSIYLYDTDLDIQQQSEFKNNKAVIGGAIRYEKLEPEFAQKLYQHRLLQIKSDKDIIFEGNVAQMFGQDVGSVPTQLVKINSENKINHHIKQVSINNFKSGGNLDIKMILLDEEQNIVNVNYGTFNSYPNKIQEIINSLKITASVSTDNQNYTDIKDQVEFILNNENQFDLSQMRIQGIPQNSSSFNITASFIKSSSSLGKTLQLGEIFNIPISFRNCQRGEIYQKINQQIYECSVCREKEYSIQIPIKDSDQFCINCPLVAANCSGDSIALREGYWRRNRLDDNILECINRPSNCNGEQEVPTNQDIEFVNYCIKGYIGPLCEICDNYGSVWVDKYGSTENYQCVQCTDTSDIAYRQVIYVLVLSAYFMYSVKKTMDKAAKYIICQTLRRMNSLLVGRTGEKDQISFYIKLALNFMQITSILSNLEYNFKKFSFLHTVGIVGSPQSLSSNSLDCLLSSQEELPIEFARVIWVSILPILYLILAAFIVLIAIALKKISKLTSKRFFYTAYTLGFISFQSGTITHLIQAMSCNNIGGYFYIKSQTNKECYSNEHLKYTLYLKLPLFFLWILIIPSFILYRLYSYRKKIKEPIQVYKYGFLTLDYKEKYFYWEFIRILMRLTVLLIGNIFSDSVISFKCTCIVILTIFYNYLLEAIKPYQNKVSQMLDYRSNQAISVLFLLYLVQVTSKDSIIIYEISQFLQFILQIVIYIYFIKLIISFSVDNNVKLNQFLRNNVPCLGKYIKKSSTGLKKFLLWRKIKLHFDDFKHQKVNLQRHLENKQHAKQTPEGAKTTGVEIETIPITSPLFNQQNNFPSSPSSQFILSQRDNFFSSTHKRKENEYLLLRNKSVFGTKSNIKETFLLSPDSSPAHDNIIKPVKVQQSENLQLISGVSEINTQENKNTEVQVIELAIQVEEPDKKENNGSKEDEDDEEQLKSNFDATEPIQEETNQINVITNDGFVIQSSKLVNKSN